MHKAPITTFIFPQQDIVLYNMEQLHQMPGWGHLSDQW